MVYFTNQNFTRKRRGKKLPEMTAPPGKFIFEVSCVCGLSKTIAATEAEAIENVRGMLPAGLVLTARKIS